MPSAIGSACIGAICPGDQTSFFPVVGRWSSLTVVSGTSILVVSERPYRSTTAGNSGVPSSPRNVSRDTRNVFALDDLGWQVITIWECETRQIELLRARLHCFLEEK